MSLTRPQKIALAKNASIKDMLELLGECKSKIPSIVGRSQYETLVNAITIESEALLIMRFTQYLEDIKSNDFHDEE